MKKLEILSAGILLYRQPPAGPEFYLVHPGGPYFVHKDEGVWSIPKGLAEQGEEVLATARREFAEETGISLTGDQFRPLGTVLNGKSGKIIHAWAFEWTLGDPGPVRSNHFEMEWPPHSGKRQSFPEVDRAAFFPLDEAMRKIQPVQAPFLTRLAGILKSP